MAASHAPPLRPAARRAQLLALFALPLAPALLCACRVGDGATRRALALCAAASAAAFGLAARGVPVASEYMARKGNVGKDINKVRTHARTHARAESACQCSAPEAPERVGRTGLAPRNAAEAARGVATPATCHLHLVVGAARGGNRARVQPAANSCDRHVRWPAAGRRCGAPLTDAARVLPRPVCMVGSPPKPAHPGLDRSIDRSNATQRSIAPAPLAPPTHPPTGPARHTTG